ncbi:hypothetical protein EV129_12716 [Rhizobium azibense]|uniref:Uncharacterized protein n=1 Tax=Rhizobium azibense TaxID=1136135 RepID=A0A4R3R9M0_9HYPH|nr:hypothetical protein EV129_12716 [Rhizobium azibense]
MRSGEVTAKMNRIDPQAWLADVLWPSSVKINDFVLLAGSPIIPFLNSRSVASQSKPFHAPTPIMKRQPQQSPHRIVDLVFVDIHLSIITCKSQRLCS